jgi:hypothetical protein
MAASEFVWALIALILTTAVIYILYFVKGDKKRPGGLKMIEVKTDFSVPLQNNVSVKAANFRRRFISDSSNVVTFDSSLVIKLSLIPIINWMLFALTL